MLTAAVKTGDLLDLALVALAVVVGVRGYRQGLLVGAASLVGFIGGAGPNIYSDATVTRQVYVLRATVRPGNSGGPLLAPNGKVDGVVFAASTTDPATGYALTAGQVMADARAGASATRPVATQGCT
jgi:S1-C subfamily serine protease